MLDDSEGVDSDSVISIKLRPLMAGKGIGSLLSLYNKALITSDPEIRILYFTKVFEYVSQSIIRLQLISAVQTKLNSAKALSPDAEYVLELENVFEEQKVFKKDKEAILTTILTCCDANELAKLAPKYLKQLSAIKIDTKKKEKEDALKEFANSLVDTRNSFAHAKSNYSPTGLECPDNQIYELSRCVILATQQTIRWFNQLSEHQRVV